MSNNKPAFIEKIKSIFKRKNTVKNRGFIKHGSFSIGLTVIVLAAIILLNIALMAASKKIPLEYDMTAKQVNSISKENKEFLKGLDEDIIVYVCGKKSDYTLYLTNNCGDAYNCYPNEKLFNLTLSLLDKYENTGDKVTVKYIDTKAVEFTELTKRFSNDTLSLGDIIVTSALGGNDKYRLLKFTDIYSLVDTTGYAAYGYSLYELGGNHLESALSGAINYVVNKETKKVAIYTGHSTTDYSAPYKALLEDNNYKADVLSDAVLTSAINDYDAVVLLAPGRDFLRSEADTLTSFLENGGKAGKGLIFIADAATPRLPILCETLADYGIEVSDGVLLETSENAKPGADMPTAVISLPTGKSDITEKQNGYITGYNVPLNEGTPKITGVSVSSCAATYPTVVAAPVGAGSDYSDYTESELKSYSTVLEAAIEGKENKGYVYALSSVEFIYSEWAESSRISNKELVLSVTNNASGKSSGKLSFVEKAITAENYSADITVTKVAVLRRFLYAVSVLVLILGFVVYFKRRYSK